MIKKETPAQVFSYEFCEIFKNTLFTEHRMTTPTQMFSYEFWEMFQNTLFKEHLQTTASA